jgi:hypothetical protein
LKFEQPANFFFLFVIEASSFQMDELKGKTLTPLSHLGIKIREGSDPFKLGVD